MQYLHTDGQLIVNEDGREVLLAGYGLGNWMVQEGFLFGSSTFMAGGLKPFMRQEGMEGGRSIDKTIIELCGRTYAKQFWLRFYENYFGEADIRDLAKRGVNSVRIPLNARVLLREEPGITFEEEGFTALQKVVDLCEQYGLYVILDLHAAVGGQSVIGCDDSWDNQPHLFTDEESRERTIVLWEEIARRYADRAVVAGYELLNEPLSLPFADHLLPELVSFYDECIARIRKIDRKHMIFLQGHRFASRGDIFTQRAYYLRKHSASRRFTSEASTVTEEDSKLTAAGAGNAEQMLSNLIDPECRNWVLTFHMYETLPDLGALGHILQAKRDLDVPVWMGETGGSSAYMTVLYEMLRAHHIGFNVWCYKGEESSDAAWLCSFRLPEEFALITDYAQKGGPKPSYEHAIRIFDEYLGNIRFENCEKHGGRTDAMLRRAPVTVPAIGYDILPGRDLTEDGSGDGSFFGREEFCAYTGYRREDHMHIVTEPDYICCDSAAFSWAGPRPPKYGDWPHLELCLDEGEYACYTVRELTRETECELLLRADADAELEVSVRGRSSRISVRGTVAEALQRIPLPILEAGTDTALKICCRRGSVTLREVRFL